MTWETWAAAKHINPAWAELANQSPQPDWWGLFRDLLGMIDTVIRLVVEAANLQ